MRRMFYTTTNLEADGKVSTEKALSHQYVQFTFSLKIIILFP